MSVQYRAILWNPQKRRYDAVIAIGIAVYLAIFTGVGASFNPNATAETLLIRALGTCAILMLHVILAIGPLCRLDPRFLPLLYNRRHLGVSMFLVALAHGAFSIFQFHSLGDANPLVSLLSSNQRFGSLAQFPFELLGLAALLILFLMAATSHDFWLHNLGAPLWKRLHMLVYAAYALLLLHVSLGALQSETSPLLVAVLALGFLAVTTLHLVAGSREWSADRPPPANAGLVEVCDAGSIAEKQAVVVSAGSERIAVFRYDGKISAVSNVCRHQNGPLGEGRIVDGCITCPWHGYQYLPDCGASPPPFTDKIETYRVVLTGSTVFVDPRPHPPGTRLEPARIPDAKHA